MSIDMYLGSSLSQAESVTNRCEKHIQDYEEMIKIIFEFEATVFSLQGETYNSARMYFLTMIGPIVKTGKLLSELTYKLCKKLPDSFAAYVYNGDLREIDLEESISDCDTQIARLQDLIDWALSCRRPRYFYIDALRMSQRVWRIKKARFEELLCRLRRFNTESKEIFQEAEYVKDNLIRAINQVKQQASFNLSTKTFDLSNLEDMDSLKFLLIIWKEKEFSKEERIYRENLQEQFGFDAETAHILVKVRRGIDDKFQDLSEKDRSYIFNLIMSKPRYAGSKWNETSGYLGMYFYKYKIRGSIIETVPMELDEVYESLGLSESEYLKATYAITMQNRMSATLAYSSKQLGDKNDEDYEYIKNKFDTEFIVAQTVFGNKISREEFYKIWDRNRENFYGKADFAHQAATMATIQNTMPFRMSNLNGLLLHGRFDAHRFTNELSGWRGDTTIQAEANPSLGKDDYKADLDADNIINIYKNSSKSYLTVANQYYRDIESGKINRADEFVKNNGIEYIKREILVASKDMSTDYLPRKSRYELEEKSITMEELKKINPIGYNFIRSLEEHQNELGEYTFEGVD